VIPSRNPVSSTNESDRHPKVLGHTSVSITTQGVEFYYQYNFIKFAGWWFSPGTPVFYLHDTSSDRLDITEILLKITLIKTQYCNSHMTNFIIFNFSIVQQIISLVKVEQ